MASRARRHSRSRRRPASSILVTYHFWKQGRPLEGGRHQCELQFLRTFREHRAMKGSGREAASHSGSLHPFRRRQSAFSLAHVARGQSGERASDLAGGRTGPELFRPGCGSDPYCAEAGTLCRQRSLSPAIPVRYAVTRLYMLSAEVKRVTGKSPHSRAFVNEHIRACLSLFFRDPPVAARRKRVTTRSAT